MSKVEEFQADLEELKRLGSVAVRKRVKEALSNEIRKVETFLKDLHGTSSTGTEVKANVARSQYCTVKIQNYAWDQSDKFVKLYVTLPNVQSLPSEQIRTNFSDKSVELQVIGLENKIQVLTIKNLTYPIKPQESYHKLKNDTVTVFLKKDSTKHWPYMTEIEKKVKDSRTPKYDEDTSDPGKSLMNLMKQMYDEGDDEMKRTIAKAWTEAREKQSSELDL
ncbi:calcyclin-binding protein [Tachypleus tridentatus]|uniref:calcyclin-binding protein n=1 Tax=Tachypleus tridentatus TaxID=6853 RepID=UPI003FCF2C79